MNSYENSLKFAQKQDQNDPLGKFREQFLIPTDKKEIHTSTFAETHLVFNLKKQENTLI